MKCFGKKDYCSCISIERITTTHQRGCGKVMFSVVSAYPLEGEGACKLFKLKNKIKMEECPSSSLVAEALKAK